MVTELWEIHMFGGLALVRRDMRIQHFRSRKASLLLAYLALNHRNPASREVLADILWPDEEFDVARNRLRVTLASIRRQLEPPPMEPSSVLAANRTHIWLRKDVFTTDVDRFRAMTRQAATSPYDEDRLQALLEAASLYTGELLPGFYEEWIEDERRELAQRYREIAGSAVDLCCENGRASDALPIALRVATMDCLDEAAHRRLMRVYVALGQSGKAREVYESLTTCLLDEVGEDPSDETKELAASFDHGKSRAAPVIRTNPPAIFEMPRTSAAELPRAASSFHGRVSEIRLIGSMLCPQTEDDDSPADSKVVRVFTLTGLGGIGKTRLALQAAQDNSSRFTAGAWFVPLADVEDARQLPRAIADALRIPLLPHQNTLDQVTSELRARTTRGPALMVLDNFEQIVEAGRGTVDSLLALVPKLSVIVTSRRLIGLTGEHECRVEALDIPQFDADRDRLMESGSVALFVARAQAALPDFQLTARNAHAVAELCSKLEGIPLAIELAAARIRVLTPSQMIQELDSRFDILVNRRASKDSPHRSLHAVVERSVNALPRSTREFLAMLSVFRGSWDLDAARAVTDQPGALDMLDDLAGSSLIQAADCNGQMRYSLLETIREYAERLLRPQMKDSLQARHASHYAGFARFVEEKAPITSERWAVCEQFEMEKDNVRAAYAWALTSNVDMALQIAASLGWVYYLRIRLREGEEMVLKALETNGDNRSRAVWAALVCLGALRCWMDDFAGAREPLDAALRGLEQDQERERRHALAYSGWTAIYEGDFERAFAELSAARRSYEEAGELWSAAACLHLLGYAACFTGRIDQAQELFAACRTSSISLNDPDLNAHSLVGLGRVAWLERNLEDSEMHYRAALSGFRMTNGRGRAYAIEGLARVASSRGDHLMSIRLIGAAQKVRDELSLRRNPIDQSAYDDLMRAARSALDEQTFNDAYEAGRRIGVEVEELIE